MAIDDRTDELTVIEERLSGRVATAVSPDGVPWADAQMRSKSWFSRHLWPLVAFGAVVVAAMAYTMLWGPLVRHGSYWIVPGDLWGTFRSAHYVAWGDIGDVYAPGTGLVTFPGISVVLAPIAFVTYHLGLSESFPYPLAHPSAWLVLGPAEAALGASVLFPLDRLGRLLGLARNRRIALCGLEAILVWPVIAIWGHPEDALAMTLALYGILAALRGRWRSCGWCWGLALIMQPLVVLGLPIVFALAPVRRWGELAMRSALPSGLILAIPLIQEWPNTSRALFQQPNYPTIDHATPWLSLAPVLDIAHREVIRKWAVSHRLGHNVFTSSFVHTIAGEVVAAGPGRVVAIALCVLVGLWTLRHRPGVPQIVWLVGLALSLRCVFESVMNPYYVWPPLAVLLVLSVGAQRRQLFISVASAAAVTVWSYRHTGEWAYWLPVVVLLGVLLASAYPRASFAERNTGAPNVSGADEHSDMRLARTV